MQTASELLKPVHLVMNVDKSSLLIESIGEGGRYALDETGIVPRLLSRQEELTECNLK